MTHKPECTLCGDACGKAITPTVRGRTFYKILLLVFIAPLAGFVLGLQYTRSLPEWLSFLLACGTGGIAFIPALLIDKRGVVSNGTTQSKLRQTASRVSVPGNKPTQKSAAGKTP